MEFNIAMPIILFPAISLILLAYTEKFMQLGRLLRILKNEYEQGNSVHIAEQILNLKKRIDYIRYMQATGTTSFFLCLLTIMVLFFKLLFIAKILFSISMLLLFISLWMAYQEVRLSAKALDFAMQDVEDMQM